MGFDSEQHRSESSLPNETERDELVAEWNYTPVDYRRDLCVHELFEAQVERTPDAIAVVFENQRLTYRELNVRANQLAHYLQKCGVGPDMLVGICVERSLEMVVGILGILKAGGAYVALDPSYPKERLAFMLEDAQVRILLTKAQLKSVLPAHRAPVVYLDTDWSAIVRENEGRPTSNALAGNLAYVMYTSGSTGNPKGVMITHATLSHFVQAARTFLSITSDDVYLHTASITFVVSVRQLMVPLCQGATVMIATSAQLRDPLVLFGLIKHQGVTTMDLVPSYWRNSIQALACLKPERRIDLLSNKLRQIVSGGEPLSSDVPKEWTTGLSHRARLFNVFGQTETSGLVSVYPIPVNYENGAGIVPIGRTIADTQVYILDSRLQPCPEGAPGELHIAGPNLARGYLNHPELTAEKFVPHPFSHKPGARLYKTGDLARVTSDGILQFVGRIDHQVKIRGIRVELEEVETALRQHPGVREAVVVAREVTPDEKCLIAYLASKQHAALAIRELRSFLRRRLPEYMVPSAFVLLETLPHTPNGKVDRRALPELAQSPPELPSGDTIQTSLSKRPDIADWFYIPSWEQSAPCAAFEQREGADDMWGTVIA